MCLRITGAIHGRALVAALLALLAAGCAMTDEKKIEAIHEVNEVFRKQYETILAEKGTRVFPVGTGLVFSAVRASLSQLGLRVESQDAGLGYMSLAAPAPAPLNLQEWSRVAQADLPIMREIVERNLGLIPSWFITFEPEGLDIVINVTVVPVAAGSEVSLTARLRQVKPPQKGFPRREYAPPTGVHMAIDKMWAQIERNLGVKGRAP